MQRQRSRVVASGKKLGVLCLDLDRFAEPA